MLKQLSENLNLLMAKTRISANELAKEIDVPASTIKRIRTGENANPTISSLLPLAKYFSVTVSELIGETNFDSNNILQVYGNSRKIPLISWQACEGFSLNKPSRPIKHIDTELMLSKNAFALEMEGEDSHFFVKGSLLIVEPEMKPSSNDFVIIIKTGSHTASIRRYIVDTEQLYLKPLIPGLVTIPMTDEYKILGVVVQYKKNLK